MSNSTILADFILANNAAMRVDCATSDELAILGLQGLGLCLGFSKDKKTIPSMGVRVAPVAYGNGSWDEMTVDCNFIPGSTSQKYIAACSYSDITLRNVRMYLEDHCTFSAPDMISAGGGIDTGKSGLSIGGYGDPKAGAPGDTWKNTIAVAPMGPFALFDVHTLNGDGTNVSITAEVPGVSAAELELLDATEWADLGFEEGDTIIVDYAGAYPMYGKIDSLSTSTMTLEQATGDSADMPAGALSSADGGVHGASPLYVESAVITC